MISTLFTTLLCAMFAAAVWLRERFWRDIVLRQIEAGGGRIVRIKRAVPFFTNERLYLVSVERDGARVLETWHVDADRAGWWWRWRAYRL